MDVRRGDESLITNLKNIEKSWIFSSKIITETNKMTNFRHFLVIKVKIKKCEAFRDGVKLLPSLLKFVSDVQTWAD